jgi:hypothetical protein
MSGREGSVATIEEVEDALLELLGRLDGVDDSSLAIMPSHRLIEARCPDLDLVRYAEWRKGGCRCSRSGRTGDPTSACPCGRTTCSP